MDTYLHHEVIITELIDFLQDISIHFISHCENIVLRVVVHEGVGKHEHHFALEFRRVADLSVFHFRFDGFEIDGTADLRFNFKETH